jgi:LacI family transcriptional regulator
MSYCWKGIEKLESLIVRSVACDTSEVEPKNSAVALPSRARSAKPISLKELAKQLNLSPTSLSLVLNGSPAAASIPKATQDLIFTAAKKFNYRPNFLARSLRVRRTYVVGVLGPELSEGYYSLVLSGVEEFLTSVGYMYLATSHRHDEKLIEENTSLLWERGVDGIIAVGTSLRRVPQWLRMVSVSGHEPIPGVTNVILNHNSAADLGLRHLVELGHREIAVIKGQSFSSDTDIRFQAMQRAASDLGLSIPSSCVAQLEGTSPYPDTGYVAAQKLLAAGGSFTALLSFNDISAIGAMRAFREAGLGVPEDVSVVGFDDIAAAAYHNPPLTTIRQPLRKMGMIAAEILVKRLAGEMDEFGDSFQVEPDLVLRESTARVPVTTRKRRAP